MPSFFKCHKIKMITLVLCNIFEQIWYSESILCRIGRGGVVPKTVYYKKIKGEGGSSQIANFEIISRNFDFIKFFGPVSTTVN